MKRVFGVVLLVLVIGAVIAMPNLVWLERSTVRVTNDGAETLRLAVTLGDRDRIELPDVAPGDTWFSFLPQIGDATLQVSRAGSGEDPACQVYVQGDMFHVEVVAEDGEVRCRADLPIFSDLLLVKLF